MVKPAARTLADDMAPQEALRFLRRPKAALVDTLGRRVVLSSKARRILRRVLRRGRAQTLGEAVEYARDYMDTTGRPP